MFRSIQPEEVHSLQCYITEQIKSKQVFKRTDIKDLSSLLGLGLDYS